jgi:hypothetical protein
VRHRVSSLLLAVVLLVPFTPAAALADDPVDTPRGAPDAEGPFGRGPEDRGRSADAPGQLAKEDPAAPARLPAQPRNDVLEDVPVDPNDASIAFNLIPYHEFAPRLRDLQASERISVEIIGQSVRGLDLHLAVATSPMSDAEWDEWQRLSDLRTADPDAAIAALEAGEYDAWKTPLLVSGNIHGNEWEGSDAIFATLERLATADDEETLRWLDEHVLAFVISNNPDGRVAGTRANANGFDVNRDYITQSQPESRIVRDQLIRYNPLSFLDIHGYVSCTLIEPTTGPHGENYEYDLYIRHALRNALAMEAAIVATGETAATCSDGAGGRRIDIPFRNRLTGWDDWPPIFTPMYAMYHGVVGHTVEVPLNPRNVTGATRFERTRVNTVAATAAIAGNYRYANGNDDLLADQLELFRRGVAGEGARPIDDPLALSLANSGTVQGYQVDNAETFADQTYPRAYLIPTGGDQRSETAAARVVQFLVNNDVQVQRATRPVTIEGVRHPAGSYVVDLHQAKRGLANTILDVGRDVTDSFPTMYDISAWSHGELWGATVVRSEAGPISGGSLQPVATATPTGDLVPGRRPLYGLSVDSLAGVQAVNALLDAGVDLSRAEDGTFVVPGSALSTVRAVADEHGVAFTNLPPASAQGAAPFSTYRIGTSAPFDEVFALQRMGFELTSVTHTGFNAGTYAFDDFDAFYVSTTAFNPLNLDATQQAAFGEWLAEGGAVVGRGGNGVTFNARADLLGVTATAGRSDANGIVAVINDPTSSITGTALPTTFVTAPRVFNVPEDSDVRVDQHLVDEGFFLAGHWRDQAPFAGRPLVVSGEARGANVTLFGSEPLYRAHPEGLHTQVAEALWRSGR